MWSLPFISHFEFNHVLIYCLTFLAGKSNLVKSLALEFFFKMNFFYLIGLLDNHSVEKV